MARRARLLKGSTALAGATIAVLTLPAGAAMAQTFTFVGGGGASWSTPGSWDTGVVPNSATAQVLLPDPPVNTGINLSGGTFTVNTLTFAPSSGTRYGIGNGTLRFDGTNATIDVQAATPEIFFLGYGPMAVVAATDLTVNVVAGGSFSIESGATLSGSGALIKTGAGTMFLAGANSHGGTVVEAGLLQTNEVNTLGPGPLTVNGGTLDLNGFNQSVAGLSGTGGAIALGTATLTTSSASSTSYAGVITGSGTLVKGGAGTQTFTGANAYIGGTTINAGTLALSGAGSLAMTGALNLANAGAGFDISAVDGNRTIGALAGSAATTVALGAHTLILGDAFNQTFAGVIGGSGGLVKQGAGTLTLDGANTYTGGTTINAGTLALTGGSLAASSAVSLAGAGAAFDMSLGFGDKTIGSLSGVAGSTVALGLNTLTFGNATNQIFAGSIDGTGGLVKQGAGLQTLSGASSYGGATLVSAGELRVDGTLSGLGAMTVNAGATLSGTGGIAGAVTVNGTLSAGHSPGTLTVGALTLNGGSTSIFELNSPGVVGGSDPVAGNDLVEVTGNLTLGGTLDARAAAAGHYRLFDYGGTLAGSFASQSVISTRGGFTIASAQVETAVPGQVNLAVFGASQTLQFWDGTNTTVNGTVDGGAGTWAPFGTNWTNSAGSANAGWGGSVGIFAGAAGGAVSVAGTVSFDTLQFSANGYALSGGTLSILPASGTSGTFNVDNGVTASIASTIADGGGTAITKVGNGRLVLSGSNSYSGGTAIDGGVLQISANANLGAASSGLSLNGGTLATTASFASFRPVALDGPGGFDVAAGTQFELGGAVSGAGSLTKLGAGTLLLSGFNSHDGGTVITAGTLQAGSADALGSGALTLNGGTFKAGTNFINSFANAIAVDAAGGRIDVNGQVMTLSGNIADGSGTGGALAFVNSDTDIGAVDLRGNNSYTGPTSVGAGVTLTALTNTAFSPNSDVTLASTGALMTNGHNTMVRSLSGSGIVVNAHDTLAGTLTIAMPSGTASFAGTLIDGEPGDAPLKLVKSGAGTQILTGTNSYTGGTTISAGVLQIGNGGTTGSIIGNVVNNRTLAFNRSDNITFTGTISGSGDVQKLGAGSLTLTGTNSYGGTLIQAGTLIGSATSFGLGPIHNNAALVFDQPGDGTFARAINGTGTLTKRGAGNLNLTGDGNLGGSTTVEAGKLSVNASFANSAVTVLSGAALGGSGTVGSTTIQSGATIAPGNSIGTLNVNGNLTLAPGSTYEVEIAGNGTADRIAVTGIATVTGSQVGVTALDPQTSYINGQRYTVLTATGGVSGTAPGAVSRSAFLDLSLDQQPNQVDLVIAVKGTSPVTPSDPAAPPVTPPAPPPSVFQTVAETRNQFATAVALNTLPQAGGTLALYNSLLMLDAPSARVAFDTLSGEIHASAKTALIDESWFMRNAMNDRLRSAFGSVGAAPMATMSYGFTADLAPGVTGPMPALRSDRFAVWGQGYGAWGRTDGNRNAAGLTRSTGGFLLGADAAVFDTLRFGLIAGYSHSEFDVKGRLSSGESDNYHLGLYGGGQWGALGLRVGASYTWHDVETGRTVAFAGFGDRLKGGYDAGTAQVFGELGYRVTLGRVELEPFVGLAYVNLHTAGFSETGGLAALTARGDDTNLGYSTLGLRASTTVAVQGMELSLRGALAWRHAFGDVDPRTTLAFAGSSAFTIAGLPIARDAALAEAGLDLAISRNATLSLSYAGQLATDAQDHSFKGALAVRF